MRWCLLLVLGFVGIGACNSGGGRAGDASGAGGSAGGDPCPAVFPGEGNNCEGEGLACDFPISSCVMGARCSQSYEGITYGELTWQLYGPTDGEACTDLGQLCKIDNAGMDSMTFYTSAVCTAHGWAVVHTACGDGFCGTCPEILPASGAPCELSNDSGGDLTYEHCTYAAEEACGLVLAWLTCEADGFVVWTSGCP